MSLLTLASQTDQLSTGSRVFVGALLVVQIGLAIAALIVLLRTSRERLRLLPVWGWALVILFISIIGPIVFLAAGRGPEQAREASDGQYPGQSSEPGEPGVVPGK